MVADERYAAGEAGAEGDRLEPAGIEVYLTEFACPRIRDVEPASMQPRRMRHRQTGCDHLAALDIDDAATADARFAPGARGIGLAGGGDETRPAFLHRHAVQVATVLGAQRADEPRLPERPEAALLIDSGETREQGVDENRAAGRKDADIVRKHVAGVLGDLRREDGIAAFQLLAARHQILEAKDVVDPGQIKAVAAHRDAEAAPEGTLGHAEPVGSRRADQKELADLIGGDGERGILLVQPGGKAGRGGHRIGRRRITGADDPRGRATRGGVITRNVTHAASAIYAVGAATR